MRNGVIFLNTTAGTFPAQEAAALELSADEAGLEVVHVSQEIDVQEITRKAVAAGRRNIVVCGGDGSINHVAQALVHTDGVLGVVPLGTFNHLARDLSIPFDWRQALEIATRGAVHQIDVGRINDTYFYDLSKGGVPPPRTSFDDGRLMLMSVQNMGRLEFTIAAARFLRGRSSSIAGFKSVRARRVRIDSAHHRIRMAIDGEVLYFKPPVLIEIVPSSLLMRMPPGYSQRS